MTEVVSLKILEEEEAIPDQTEPKLKAEEESLRLKDFDALLKDRRLNQHVAEKIYKACDTCILLLKDKDDIHKNKIAYLLATFLIDKINDNGKLLLRDRAVIFWDEMTTTELGKKLKALVGSQRASTIIQWSLDYANSSYEKFSDYLDSLIRQANMIAGAGGKRKSSEPQQPHRSLLDEYRSLLFGVIED